MRKAYEGKDWPLKKGAVFLLLFFLSAGLALGDDPCLECHEKKTPGIVNYWKNSIHFKKDVGCSSCHGTDIEANHKRKVVVDAAKCGGCHMDAFTGHRLSRHGIGLRAGRGCTRNLGSSDERAKNCVFCHKPGSSEPLVKTECAMFLAQSAEMQREGCGACHRVEVSCDACHTKHGTDLSIARNPRTCGVCHMGPDHPQLEMWETSRHGVLYNQGGKAAGPSCVTCHMSKGSHNVSRGIVTGMPEEAAAVKKTERQFMIQICAECHTPNFASGNLDDGDRIERQERALIEEAKGIAEGLQKDGLLYPPPSERPPHPLWGKKFVIGPDMLYENLSSVESLFFRMKQFYYPISYKGVFHQNPDYAHWYGNAPLKLTLSEMKSEAALLRSMNALKKRLDSLDARKDSAGKGEISKLLSELNEKRLKGEMTDADYEKAKKVLLDEKGL